MPRFSPMGVTAVVDGIGNYTRDMGKMSQSTERTHKSISGLGKVGLKGLVGAAGFAAKAIAGIGVAAGAAGVALGGLAVKLAIDAAPIADLEKGFNAIAENAGKVGPEVLAQLQDVTAGTIRAADLMQLYNKGTTLLGENFNDIVPIMGDLIAQGAAIGLSPLQAVEDFTTGVARESKMILDNLGITVQLSEAHEAFAASLGKSVDELTATERQAALLAAANRELQKTAAALPNLNEFASTSIAQLKTSFAETKDEIGKALVPVLVEFLQAIKGDLGPGLLNIVEIFKSDMLPSIRRVAQFIAANLPKAFKFAQTAFTFFGRILQKVTDILFTWVIPGFNFLYRIFVDNVLPIIEKAVGFIGNLFQSLGIAGEGVGTFADTITGIIPPVVFELWEKLKTKAGEWYDVAKTWWEEHAPEFKQAFIDVKDYIVNEFIPNALEFLTTEFEPVIEAAGRLWDSLLDQKVHVLDAWDDIKAKAEDVWAVNLPLWLEDLQLVWDNLITLITGGLDETGKDVDTWGETIIKTIGNIIEFGIDVLAAAVTGLIQLLALLTTALVGDWEEFGQLLIKFGERDREILKDLGLDIIDIFAGPAGSIAGEIQKALGEEPTFTFGVGEAAGGVYRAQQEATGLHAGAFSQPLTTAPAQVGGGLHTEANTQNFSLTVNTSAPAEPVIADFRMMAAMARGAIP